MWLHLNLDGIELHFRITKYRKSIPDKWDVQWCQVDLTLRSDKWLSYHIPSSSETLLACEVEEICNKFSNFLEGKIQIKEKLEFVEPDLEFILNPKDAELRVHFWNDGLTANYLSLFLDRNDLEYWATYLRYVTNEISKEDESVQELIKHDIIRPCYNVC